MSTEEADSSPDFDPGALQALPMVADGSAPEFAQEILRLFEQSSSQALGAIESAAADGRPADMQRRLHTLKSSSAQVGAMRLSRAAGRFETALRNGQPAQPHWCAELRQLHDRARSAWQAQPGAKCGDGNAA